MTRAFFMLFSLIAYAIFFGSFLALIGFVGNLPGLPIGVDRGPVTPLTQALIVNLALIALFGLQHSIMARQGFKAAWTRIVPAPIERSAYVLFASLAIVLLLLFWHPIPQMVWQVDNAIGVGLLWALFALGWAIVLVSTFLINHFELFGLSQAWSHMRERVAPMHSLRQPLFYKLVRHPIYAGFLIAFWATPVMTVGHALFALGMTVYIFIGIRYEERDLVQMFGPDYEDYRRNVGMVVPRRANKA